MSEKPKTYAMIGKSVYEVRREGDERGILADGRWMQPAEFTDWLASEGKFDELAELVAYGFKILREEP